MNKSHDIPTSFEKQLHQSAQRLREVENQQLPLRPSPRRRHFPITWVASVAAACIGWLVGIAFPLSPEQPAPDLALNTQPDTVIQYRERLVHDTIIQKVKVPVRVKVAAPAQDRLEYYADTKGCNVECDGIDYAMLVGM